MIKEAITAMTFVIFGASCVAGSIVKVGVVIDQTTSRVASEETLRGLQIGVDYLLKTRDQKIQLNFVDTGPLATGTRQAMIEQSRTRENQIIIGEIASSKAEVAAEVAEQNKLVMITPYATAGSITKGRKYVFRTCATHETQSRALANFFLKSKIKNAGVVYDLGQLYSVDLANNFKNAFTSLGGKVVTFDGILSSAENFGKSVDDFQKRESDVLFLPMYEETTVRFLNQLLGTNKRYGMIVGGDGWEVGSVFKSVILPKFPKISLSFVTHHSATLKNKLQQEFENMYLAKFKVSPKSSGSFLAFDTILLVGEVFKENAPKSQEAIREKLAGHVKIAGTTGVIEFLGKQDPQHKQLYLTRFEGAKLERVEAIFP